jgi:hypothetical protein
VFPGKIQREIEDFLAAGLAEGLVRHGGALGMAQRTNRLAHAWNLLRADGKFFDAET